MRRLAAPFSGCVTKATARLAAATPIEENVVHFPTVSYIRLAALISGSALLWVAGCTEMISKPASLAGGPQAAPFCTGQAAQHCGYCISDCSDSLCTLNRDRCDPRGVPLGLPFATMYRRCASECSYKINGLQPPGASAAEAKAANAPQAQPPCTCQQPAPIPGFF